ncbi:hypothetical protein EC846_1527 [Acinetobacter sp. BIGb0102]|nr:hypothetical protein EC846_1527 [Acinetobacter sp. BIGb0102]
MSWLFSQALVAEYSDRISWDVQQCAQLNVMPTPHKFWRNDKMMEFSRLSQFGLTLNLLTEDHGGELLMLYLADFHVRTSHLQEKAQGSMGNVQDFGQKWHELSVKFDLEKSGWKTHQCLFPEDLPESSVTLPKWGMTRTGHVFQHLTLERPINVTVSGLLPTPKASDSIRKDCRSERNRRAPCLESRVKMWATPKALDGNKRGMVNSDPRNGLAGQVKNFPTPQASDCRDRGNLGSPVIQRRIKNGKQIGLSMSVSDTSGALNPDWVEWLMGWPIGWTDLKPLEMDKFQSWLKTHSNI